MISVKGLRFQVSDFHDNHDLIYLVSISNLTSDLKEHQILITSNLTDEIMINQAIFPCEEIKEIRSISLVNMGRNGRNERNESDDRNDIEVNLRREIINNKFTIFIDQEEIGSICLRTSIRRDPVIHCNMTVDKNITIFVTCSHTSKVPVIDDLFVYCTLNGNTEVRTIPLILDPGRTCKITFPYQGPSGILTIETIINGKSLACHSTIY